MNVAHLPTPPRHVRAALLLVGILIAAVPGGAVSAAPLGATLPAGAPTGPTIPAGVHAAGVDLSGLDEASARQVLATAFAGVGQGQVTVTADSTTTPITFESLGRHVDIDELISEAFSLGNTGSLFQRVLEVAQVVTAGINLRPTVIFDEGALGTQLAQIAATAGTPAVDAQVIPTATGFSTTRSKTGRTFDTDSVLPPLVSTLHEVATPPDIPVTLTGITATPTISDATAAAASAAATIMSAPLVLANGGQTWTIPASTVHSWISFVPAPDGTLPIEFDDGMIQGALVPLVTRIHRDAVAATWNFATNGVVVVPSKDGRELDIPRTSRRIQVFLTSLGAGAITPGKKLGPTVTALKPTLTTEQAQAQTQNFQLLSTWTTYFQPAAHNGFGANIWVPAGYLDNQIVLPGETFSFWGRVGEVSLARGYKMGGAIINGHTQEGVALAGGICSTSTTLFNAVARAGFKLGERSNHFYYITRYPVGLDATVSKSGGSQQDMTWTNDTPNPVLIKSFKTSGSVSFSLFGIPTGRTVTFSTPIITNYTKATSDIVKVSTLPTGRLVRIEYPDDGFDASVTRYVRDASGKLIDQRTFFSRYATIRGVQYLGDPAGKNITVPSYAPGAQGG
jgi:vancomycin resistance protein YoaR